MDTTGARRSRWTLRYFAIAYTSFVLAQALFASGLAYPRGPLLGPWTLAAVHLTTVGWLTLLILGALDQFVPVLAARPIADERAGGLALGLVALGLVGLVRGFLGLPGGPLPSSSFPYLPAGGALAVAGALVAAGNLAATLLAARPVSLPGRYVLAGLAFLVATTVLGVALALALALPGSLPPGWGARLLGEAVAVHLAGGIGGFFTLTAMGVAYKLLAMFTLAPEREGLRGHLAFALAAGGLAVAWATGLVATVGSTATLGRVADGGAVASLAGVFLYLVDIAGVYRARARRALELGPRFAAWAFAALGLTAAGLLLAGLTGTLPERLPALVDLALFGWLSGLGLSQLYKIVPFLTWLERFGARIGRGPTPRVQDLVVERRAEPAFVLYFAAVGVGVVADGVGWIAVGQAAMAAQTLASLAIARELLAVRTARRSAPAAAVRPRGAAPAASGAGLSRRTDSRERSDMR